MFIPFTSLPPSSRIWIYQCNRILEPEEISQIKELAYEFVNNWTAHKQTLHASFEVMHNLFLVLAVDQNINDASGCSVDTAFNFIQNIEKLFQIKLLDRMTVAYMQNHEIHLQRLHDFTAQLKSGATADLKIFNNLVATKGELVTDWLQPVEQSWVMKMV